MFLQFITAEISGNTTIVLYRKLVIASFNSQVSFTFSPTFIWLCVFRLNRFLTYNFHNLII